MAEKPNVLAVIPARGGSKRFPRKNIYVLRGHPLIAYTIKAAQDATKLTDFLVSTDDEEIAAAAKRYGAPVPFIRPSNISGDADRNTAVMRHALEFMEEKTGRRYDIIMLLQPTCPIRSSVASRRGGGPALVVAARHACQRARPDQEARSLYQGDPERRARAL